MTHQITIAWDASPPPVSGYNIYRGTPQGKSGVPLNSRPVVDTSFRDGSVLAGQTYTYSVKAVLNGVESESSIEITGATVPFCLSPLHLDLDVAASFVVLGATKVSNAPGNTTTANGDVGVSPGDSIVGFGAPSAISGVFHAGDFVSAAGQLSVASAFESGMRAGTDIHIPGRAPRLPNYMPGHQAPHSPGVPELPGDLPQDGPPGETRQERRRRRKHRRDGYHFPDGYRNDGYDGSWDGAHWHDGYRNDYGTDAYGNFIPTGGGPEETVITAGDIGGTRLGPGVYSSPHALEITGSVVLDASGDPEAVWIFQIASTLKTAASNSNVVLIGGAEAANVYWLVGSSATLGTLTTFAGNLIARDSITVAAGAAVNGRLFAMTGSVSLDGNDVMLFQACDLQPLPPSGPNVPPEPPQAPLNVRITSEE